MGNVGNVIQTRNVSYFKLRVDYGFSKCADFLNKLIFCYLLLVTFKFYQLPARKLYDYKASELHPFKPTKEGYTSVIIV